MATLAPGEKARMYALGKLARGGATRGGYTSSLPFIAIGGVQVGTAPDDPNKRILIADLGFHDGLDDVPDTLHFTTRGWTPTVGSVVTLALGSKHPTAPLFAGHVIGETQGYFVDNPATANVYHRMNAIDHTWLLGAYLANDRYTGNTAGAIAAGLLATWVEPAIGLTLVVAPDAAAVVVDDISFSDTSLIDCFAQLAGRIGGHWYVDSQKRIHLYLATELETSTVPDVTPTNASTFTAGASVDRDLSQVVTRGIVEGGGVTAIAPAAPGDTLIAVDSTTWYQGAQYVESGPQRITVGSLEAGGGGAFVGPGAGPSAAPTVTPAAGGSLAYGTYQYGYTQVTAAGETKLSPLGSGVASVVADPTLAPAPVQDAASTGIYQNMFPVGSTVQLCIVYANADGSMVTANGPVAAPFTVLQHATMGPAYGQGLYVNVACSADPRVVNVYIYAQCSAFGATYRQLWSVNNNPSLAGQGNVLGTRPYRSDPFASWPALSGVNNSAANQFTVGAIATGPASVTSRKLYRTVVNGSAPLLVTTIADNTTTSYTDNKADGALGAAAPASDTSGLTMPTGQVAAGSTSLPLASAAGFNAAGGYAIIGNGEQVVRYTGISGNSLTGIPATGAGAITAAVAYNSTATAAPAIRGIPASGLGAIRFQIQQGDNVNLVVVYNDATAQANLAAALGETSGVREGYLVDQRIGVTEATARARALVAERGAVEVTVKYTTLDGNTRSGRLVTINLPILNVNALFKIQDVTMKNFSGVAGQAPTRDVVASSRRYPYADLLRLERGIVGTVGV